MFWCYLTIGGVLTCAQLLRDAREPGEWEPWWICVILAIVLIALWPAVLIGRWVEGSE